MERLQKGFTLIELMIVVAIIGILAAVAIPAYQDYIARAQMSEAVSLLSSGKAAMAEHFADHGYWPATTSAVMGSTTGKYTASIGRQSLAKRSSLNSLPIARVAEGGDADVDAAVTATRSALDGEYCVHRVAANVDVGITWANSWFLRDLHTPFGGARHSGIGREGGVHSLEFYTELRNVCIKL